jgi:hypothetical protein
MITDLLDIIDHSVADVGKFQFLKHCFKQNENDA